MPRTSAPARLCSILPYLVLLLVTQALQLATALPVGPCPRCGGGTLPPIDPIVDPRVAGQLIAVNCPNTGFYVNVNGGRINPGSATVTQQRTSIMAYSKTYPETTTGPFNIIPFAPCTGGTWSPASRTATGPVATGQNFVYTRGSPISLSLIASVLTSKLSGLKLRLNNYNTARQGGSYLQLGTTRVPFTIPKAVVDLDLCGICPDLGDGIFYINNMALSSARVTAAGDKLVFAFTFKDSNPEIKGFHNSLGDSGMPDFQINGKAGNPGAVVTVNARIVASGATGITLAPYGAQLIADVSSTGGCSPFGIDICNALLGTSGKVRSAVTNGVNGVLGSSKVKGMIADIIKKYLVQLGYGNLQSWGLYGGVLYVVK